MAEITPNIATTSAAGTTQLRAGNPEVLWAMDLDDNQQPVRAHRVVDRQYSLSPGDAVPREVRVTACGLRLTRDNHPIGWWEMAHGALPLQPEFIHCGLRR